MWPNLQETADLVAFAEEMLNGKLLFCAVLAQLFSGLYRLEATESISKSEFHYFKLGHYGGHVCL